MISNSDFKVGDIVQNWSGAKKPEHIAHKGKYVRLEPLHHSHIQPLYEALQSSPDYDWYYMPFGPFESQEDLSEWGGHRINKDDPLFFTIISQDNDAVLGFLSFMRINSNDGSIEIGFIQFSQKLQRSTGATEAIWMLIKHAFELGYRRVEWKCDNFNKRSKSSAKRLGFKFEGVFRQARVVKGRNRDTAWYSIIDKDWIDLQKAYEVWFNQFDSSEKYISLSKLTENL